MNTHPTVCNLCGGTVVYMSNSCIYGTQFGSGYCYYCRNCGAYVGTHKPYPKQALGILANAEMRNKKIYCHKLFDTMWYTPKERKQLYAKLAKEMKISINECHFGYFDIEQLDVAYKILKAWENKNESI